MATSTYASPPPSPESSRFAAIWKKITGKSQSAGGVSPPGTCSEPGMSREASPSSGLIRRVSRKVVPGLPRAKTFKRQVSEDREKLQPVLPTPAERRAVSVDRRLHLQRSASRSSRAIPRASAPEFFDEAELLPKVKLAALSAQIASAPQSPVDEKLFLSLNDASATNIDEDEDHTDEAIPTYPEAISTADIQSIDTSQYDAMIHDELEHKWILNLSMHFRDRSNREKFFVTYREKDSMWRRVTISLDYRNPSNDSLEKDLLATKFQRDKSAKIYEAIRESLQDIQFYDTVTNLKLETADGRLHVHVVEDINEIIHFPSVRMVQHMGCRRIRESRIKFDSHMSGFVYKVEVDGQTLIKKEIPGPETIDEFLYEVNALNSLRFSKSIIEFYGVVVDDDDTCVKGLLISYAERGALVDVIYDTREQDGQDLPWPVREKWARQIVGGLSHIHEAGFVQGDFTLSNIVIDDFGNAKIIDINRRGCPVGWEPPEATPLIDSNQRISMYIGVKSDLFQLGMVLWALATLDDEPEAHRRPLRLKAELDVPPWYRRIVETCLHENPRHRLQATALLTLFPETPYDDAHEEREVPSISVHDGTSFQQYVEDDNCRPPEIRTVEPRASWPYSIFDNTQATSPSFSDEPDEPPRGRSPASPLPRHHDLYNSPYNDMWAKAHDAAVVGDDPTAGEVGVVGTTGDLHDITVFPNMEDELEQIEADLRADLKHEQAQTAGGNSQSQDVLSKTVVVEPLIVADGLDEKETLLNVEDGSVAPAGTKTISTSDGSSKEGTPVPTRLQPAESSDAPEERGLEDIEDIETAEDETNDDADDVIPLDGDETEAAIASDSEDQAEHTNVQEEPSEPGTDTDDFCSAYTCDRTDDEEEADDVTRHTEATITTTNDLTSHPKNLIPLENNPSEATSLGGVDTAGEKTGEVESAVV